MTDERLDKFRDMDEEDIRVGLDAASLAELVAEVDRLRSALTARDERLDEATKLAQRWKTGEAIKSALLESRDEAIRVADEALKAIASDVSQNFECHLEDEQDEDTGLCCGDDCIHCALRGAAISALSALAAAKETNGR